MNALFTFYESEKKTKKKKNIKAMLLWNIWAGSQLDSSFRGGGRHLPSPPDASYGPVYHCIALKKIDL